MRKSISPLLLALLLVALPAQAQFEGVLAMKVTMAGKDGSVGGATMTVAVAKAGARSEMNVQMGAAAMKVVMLQKTSTPNMVYRLNDASKTYTEMELAKMPVLGGQPSASKEYTVEKLGRETILGYSTQHVLVKEKNPAPGNATTAELWTAQDLLDYATFSKMQPRQGKGAGEEALIKALKAAGADGLPLKSVSTTPEGTQVTMEVLSVDKKSLPAATFEIPAGYTKSAGGLSGLQADDAKQKLDEAKKRMDDAMKNMTPEQRAMIEKLMKQRNGGTQ